MSVCCCDQEIKQHYKKGIESRGAIE